MKSSALNNPNTVLLARENVYFGGMNLTYQLLVCTGGELCSFLIRVRKDGEMCEAGLGIDLARALQYYQSIVRGTVTPCALEEFLEDLQYA